MFIYHVERTDRIGYDECAGFVIVARSENEARTIAAANAGDEMSPVWLYQATVVQLGNSELPIAESRIVMRDYRAG